MAPNMSSLHLDGLEKLNETNYSTWKLKMKSLLLLQDFWELVSPNKPTNLDRKASTKWDKKAMFGVHMRKLSVKNDILSHLRDVKNPKEVLDKLKMIYESKKCIKESIKGALNFSTNTAVKLVLTTLLAEGERRIVFGG